MDKLTFKQLTRDEQDRVLRALYAEGCNYPQLHEQTGLSETWVRRRLINLGVEVRRRPPAARPLSVPASQIAEDYNNGDSIQTLAERYDSYYKQIRQTLIDQGVVLRPSTKAHLRAPDPQAEDHSPHRT